MGQFLAVRGDARNQFPSALPRGNGSPKHKLHGPLWFFLCDQGDDVRKWDGEPTFQLEAHVSELRGKKAVKEGSPKKVLEVKEQSY